MRARGYRPCRRTTHLKTVKNCLNLLTGEKGRYAEMPCFTPVLNHFRVWTKKDQPLVFTEWAYDLSGRDRQTLRRFVARWGLQLRIERHQPHPGFKGFEYMIQITAR